jgi:hypothetical protein
MIPGETMLQKSPSHNWIPAIAVGAFLTGVLFYQNSSFEDSQQAQALEIATLKGRAQATEERVQANEKVLTEVNKSVQDNTKAVEEVNKTVQAQGKQLERQERSINSVKKQVKTLQNSPSSTVVFAATTKEAQVAEWDKWKANHPGWEKYRSCMNAKMVEQKKETGSADLNKAYTDCESGR